MVELKFLHLYCFKQRECEMRNINAYLTVGANTKDAAKVVRATDFRHAETIAHEVDGVNTARAKGGNVIKNAR
jgi:hypothetical protein